MYAIPVDIRCYTQNTQLIDRIAPSLGLSTYLCGKCKAGTTSTIVKAATRLWVGTRERKSH